MQANLLLLGGIVFGLVVTATGDQGPARTSEGSEEKLREFLFANYSKNQRPSTPARVSLNLVFNNIDEVDPMKERISLKIWFRMYWTDNRLQWNSSENNISSLTLEFEEIWTPDVALYLAVGTIRDFGISNPDGLKMNLIVYSNGIVFFSQPTSIQSACALNIADFPFDDQTCQLTFGSWTMDSTLLWLDLNKDGIDLTYFITNNMWDLLEISAEMRKQMYSSHDNDLSVVVYTLVLRRRALFFVVNYIVPPVAISFLSLLLFLIPPEVGKRMEAGINLLLCLSVYLLLVNSKMPKTSTAFPLLTKFYGSVIIILVLAMCCTCLVYALYFMNSSGLELHHASFFLRLKNFTLGRLQPLLFADVQIPCKRSNPDPKRRKSKVHPAETADLNLKEVDSKTDSQIQSDDQKFTTSREAPLIITSGSHEFLPRISAAGQEDQEGHLKLATIGSSIDLSSSFSSFASFRSEENTAVAREDMLTPVENVNDAGAPEEIKKVTFARNNDGFVKTVKRRATSIHCTESAVKRTEHTLVCSAGSSWFIQSSWDESLEENAEECGEDVSSQLNDGPNQLMALNSKGNKSDSDTDDHAPVSDGYVELSRSCDRENTKRSNTEQWKKAALVLDRMFIIVLFMSIVISFVACLLLAPRVRNSFSP